LASTSSAYEVLQTSVRERGRRIRPPDQGAVPKTGLSRPYFDTGKHAEDHKTADYYAALRPAFFQKAIGATHLAAVLFDQERSSPPTR
jgi:hypothetical protein